MNTHLFLITAKTNLHVGNESGNDFTIIDKAIQRDPLTDLPCINSSSLKGAVKEYCAKALSMNNETLTKLFGSDKSGKQKQEDTQKGSAFFFDAKLLYLPQQDDETLYHYATSESVKAMFEDRAKLFGMTIDWQKIEGSIAKKTIETKNDKAFNAICNDDNLPIIARNCLENGESKNLWYEQIAPTQTVFYTFIQEEGTELKESLNGKIVQIGANATIGYGYCLFTAIN